MQVLNLVLIRWGSSQISNKLYSLNSKLELYSLDSKIEPSLSQFLRASANKSGLKFNLDNRSY